MIILGLPLFAWLGMFIFLLILIQVSLGIAMVKYQKDVLKYHSINGFIIITLAVVHLVLGLLFMLKGIVV